MSFNVFEDDAIMAEFDRISAEPIDNEPYSLVKNPVPVVESILDFNGHKIDTGSWCTGDGVCEDKQKVGKAKTASNPKLAKAAPEKSGEKKDNGKVVENVDAKEKKADGKTTEVKTSTEVKAEKAPEAGQGGKFDSAAKSAASSNQSGAQKNKKFEENAKLQKHIDLFKKGVRALATDSKSAADAEKVLKKFDKISSYLKPRTELTESVAPRKAAMLEADGGSIVVKYANRAIQLNKDADGYTLGGAEGSKSLASLVGSRVKVDPSTIQKGQELKMAIEVDGQFKNWHSGSPVTSVTDSGASEAPATDAPKSSDEAPAEPEDPDSFMSVMKRRNDAIAAKKAADAAASAEEAKRRYNAILSVDWNNKDYDVGSALKGITQLFEKAGLGVFGDKLKVDPDWKQARESGQLLYVFDNEFKIRRDEEAKVQSMLDKHVDGDVITRVQVHWVPPKVYEEYSEKATYNP